MRRISGTFLGLAFSLSCSVSASADIFDSALDVVSEGLDFIWPDDVELEDFSLRLGAGTGIVPDYEGSDNYRFRILPLIDLRYKNLIVLQGTKLRVNALGRSLIQAGPIIAYDFGRDEKRNAALEGLGNIGGTFEVGAFVEARNKELLVLAEFREALKSGHGRTIKIEAGHGIYKNDSFDMALGARLKWQSREYTQTYFGITAAQSIASGLPAFTPENGFFEAGINWLSRYKLDDHWSLHSIAGYSRILGDAADSPLIRDRGSANQFIFGTGARYQF